MATLTEADGLPPPGTFPSCRTATAPSGSVPRPPRPLADGRWRIYTTADGLARPSVDVILQDRDGVLWFGASHPTEGGLTRFDGRTWEAIDAGGVLPHASVNDIMQMSGAIWVSTGYARRGGAHGCLRESDVADKRGWLAGERVRSIFEDRSGDCGLPPSMTEPRSERGVMDAGHPQAGIAAGR